MNNSVITGLYFVFGSLFLMSAAYADPFIDWYKDVGKSQQKFGLPMPKNEIIRLLEEAKLLVQTGSNDPIFYLQMAALSNALYSYYYDETYPKGMYDPQSSEAQVLIKEYSNYYRQALKADDNPDAPAHLSHEALTAMGKDPFVYPDVKNRAMNKKIELIHKGDVLHPNQEWYTYKSLLGNYAEQKDYDNYLKTVNEMIERFPNSSRMDELVEYKHQAETAIEKRNNEIAIEDNRIQTEPYAYMEKEAQHSELYTMADYYSEVKSDEVKSQPLAVAPRLVNAKQPVSEEKPDREKTEDNFISMILLPSGAILLASLFGWLFLRHKRKLS